MKLKEQVLKEALALEHAIRVASLRLKEIKDQAKACGSFSTRNFVVSVKEQRAERLLGKDAFIDAYGRNDLVVRGLIQEISFEIVKIAPKKQ